MNKIAHYIYVLDPFQLFLLPNISILNITIIITIIMVTIDDNNYNGDNNPIEKNIIIIGK